MEPKASLTGGGEAPTERSEFFTCGHAWRSRLAKVRTSALRILAGSRSLGRNTLGRNTQASMSWPQNT